MMDDCKQGDQSLICGGARTGLPKERLLVSVHKDDHESARLWHAQEQVPLERIVRR